MYIASDSLHCNLYHVCDSTSWIKTLSIMKNSLKVIFYEE